MAQADAVEQVALLRAAYPRDKIPADTLGVYATKLADINGPLLAAAVNRLIEDSKFFPTIAEIRTMAARLAGLLPVPSGEALAIVRRADKREAIYRRDGSFAYEERYWEWPDDVSQQTIDLCCEAIQRAGDPIDPKTEEAIFAWDSAFKQVYDARVSEASRNVLADLSRARLPAHPQKALPE